MYASYSGMCLWIDLNSIHNWTTENWTTHFWSRYECRQALEMPRIHFFFSHIQIFHTLERIKYIVFNIHGWLPYSSIQSDYFYLHNTHCVHVNCEMRNYLMTMQHKWLGWIRFIGLGSFCVQYRISNGCRISNYILPYTLHST